MISVLVGKLSPELQPKARLLGKTLALIPQLVLLLFIGWIIGLTEPLFAIFGHGFSGNDIILAGGGVFLIYNATQEIHSSLEGEEGHIGATVRAGFTAVVSQIALINLVFSIDSIVTAVGMANEIWVMAVAVIASMVVLAAAAGPVGKFVDRHPTVKILALGFLIMIGMTLVADAFGVHIPKGYVYSAMIFSVLVEGVNMLHRRKAKPVHLHNQYGPEVAPAASGGDARSGRVSQSASLRRHPEQGCASDGGTSAGTGLRNGPAAASGRCARAR